MTVTVVWGFFIPARRNKKENLFVWALVVIKKHEIKGKRHTYGFNDARHIIWACFHCCCPLFHVVNYKNSS